jgi:hypothetical protein
MSDISIKKIERRDDATMEMSPRPFHSGKHLANPVSFKSSFPSVVKGKEIEEKMAFY